MATSVAVPEPSRGVTSENGRKGKSTASEELIVSGQRGKLPDWEKKGFGNGKGGGEFLGKTSEQELFQVSEK